MKGIVIVALALVLVGCAKNIDNPDAVKQGIIKDIGKKVDVQNMDVYVDSVSFRNKEATATVSFAPKGMDRTKGITMRYNLTRQGDEWHVKDRDMARHEEAAPAAGAPAGSASAAGQALPPGHPQLGGDSPASPGTGIQIPIPRPVTGAGPIPSGSTQLPAGHPPVAQ